MVAPTKGQPYCLFREPKRVSVYSASWAEAFFVAIELLEARASRAVHDAAMPLSWRQAAGPLIAWAVFLGLMALGGLLAELTQQGQVSQVANVPAQSSAPNPQASVPDRGSIRASFAP
jgi:hypothetical protein